MVLFRNIGEAEEVREGARDSERFGHRECLQRASQFFARRSTCSRILGQCTHVLHCLVQRIALLLTQRGSEEFAEQADVSVEWSMWGYHVL